MWRVLRTAVRQIVVLFFSAPWRLCARKRFLGFDLKKNMHRAETQRRGDVHLEKISNRQSSEVGKPHIGPAFPGKTKNSAGPVASIASLRLKATADRRVT